MCFDFRMREIRILLLLKNGGYMATNRSAAARKPAFEILAPPIAGLKNDDRSDLNERPPVKLEARNLSFSYGPQIALRNVSMPLYQSRVTALMGPSGCGKSTLLRIFNRMHDLYPDQTVEGEVLLDGQNILNPAVDLTGLRARIGMIFQKPTPFPMSVYENIAFGIRLREKLPRGEMDARVEQALTQAALWDEVKDDLKESGLSLSGGQQQRLCIARAIAVKPEILLFDEPCSALDPLSTMKIEATIDDLKARFTIAIVTHNLQQAARVSDFTAFMYLGELVEFGTTNDIFTCPQDQRTSNFITGRFG